MQHLRLIVTLSLVAAALSTIPFAAGQQPTGDPFSTEIRKVKDGLYVIPGYDGAVTGGNVAVRVTSEGTIIVDDRLPPSSAEIAGKVRSVTSQPIRYVLSTHGHGDHTGGHPEFIKVAEIVAHRNNRANMVRSKLAAPPRLDSGSGELRAKRDLHVTLPAGRLLCRNRAPRRRAGGLEVQARRRHMG